MNETDIHTFLNSLTKEQFVLFLEREVKQNSDLLQNLYNFLTSSLQVESVPKELDFTSSVSKHSSAQEKISLFRSFFCSRTDVFALRWANEKTGASGYSPVCANKWVQGKCNIKKIPCAKCAFRSSLELSDEYIFKHLVGKDSLCRDVIGMYALRSDDTCRFLALDFDEETWKSEVKALRKLCSENLIPVAVEISRSGNGAHIWFFFEEPITATLARNYGTAILQSAMCENHALSFSSFDRMFPNQNTMPKGGYGNLIALPLQGQAVMLGHSVFVDERFLPYQDQWSFLSSCKKLTKDEVSSFITTLHRKYHFETAEQNNEKSENLIIQEEIKPARINRKVSLESLSEADFLETVKISFDSQIHIQKHGISERVLGAFRRLAVFSNPDFYKTERMRLPVWNKPRYIDCSKETPEELLLPRGCLEEIKSCLDNLNVVYEFSDNRTKGTTQNFSFNGTLKENQTEALQTLLTHDMGILSAGTGFGKTVTSTALIASRNTSTLIIVHTQALLEQWKKAIKQFLDITPGIIAAGKDKSQGLIDMALIQSLIDSDKATKTSEIKQLTHEYGMIIVDECHHISAFSFESVLKSIPAKYVYGLTATPIRRDGHQPIIFMQCGPIRYSVDTRQMNKQQDFSHYLIPRFTSFKPLSNEKLVEEMNITEIYSELCESLSRNEQIIEDIKETVLNGRTALVLSERISHISILAEKLQNTAQNVIIITGKGTQKQKRELLEKLSAVPDDETLIVLATGKYAGEGFDLPRLDTLFLAMPFSWKGTLSQYCGRLHRNYEGKTEVQIYDYLDFRVPVLERMYHKRLKGYKQLGYTVKPQESENENDTQKGTLFSASDYYETFIKDCLSAQKHIYISSPYLIKSAVQNNMFLLRSLIQKGIKIFVTTRMENPEQKDKIEKQTALINLLEQSGITVTQTKNLSQRIAIIDDRILWYGSINLLGFVEEDDCIMRLENPKIVGEILAEI